MSKKGVDISFIKPAMDNDDWKREVTDVEKCLVIVEVYSSKWGACVHLDGHFKVLGLEQKLKALSVTSRADDNPPAVAQPSGELAAKHPLVRGKCACLRCST